MEKQIVSKRHYFNGIKNFLSKLFQLVTLKNVWQSMTLVSFFLGAVCLLWIIIFIIISISIALWSVFGTTSFTGDDLLSQLAVNFWQLTAFGKVVVVALVINSINRVVKIVTDNIPDEDKDFVDKFFDNVFGD